MSRLSTIFYLQTLLIGLLFYTPLKSQNLVFNGGFEDVNFCKELKEPCNPSAWFWINRYPKGYHKRGEISGYRNYALLFGAFRDTIHEYWQTMLADKLIPGKEYKLSFDVTAENNRLDCYGFLFTNTLFYSAWDTILTSPHYIKMSGDTAKLLKSGWLHIEKRFIADKDFQYLIVGKFSKACYNSTLASFAFDNLVIQPVKRYSILNKSLKDSLYSITKRHEYKIPFEDNTDSNPPVQAVKKSDIDSLVVEDIQFEYNKYTITNPETFEKHKSKFDIKSINRIEVYGYTDTVGSQAYNLNLSQLRADAVKNLLAIRYSIPENIIVAVGKGASSQYADNRRNRRVEILVIRKPE